MAVALRLAHAALREAAPSVTDVATFDAELRRRGEAAAGTGNGGEDDEDVDDQAVRGNEKLVAWRKHEWEILENLALIYFPRLREFHARPPIRDSFHANH